MKEKVYLKRFEVAEDSCHGCYFDGKNCHGECNGNYFIVKQVFPKRVKIVKNDKKHHACSICCFANDNKNCCKYEMKYKCGINSIHFELINE